MVEPLPLEVPLEEQAQMLRDSMVALLRRDPHCPVARLLGQALMDLISDMLA